MSKEIPRTARMPDVQGDVESMRAALDEARLALAESGRLHEEALTHAEARVDRLESQLATLQDQLTRLRKEAAALQRRNRELEASPRRTAGGTNRSEGPDRDTAVDPHAAERAKRERSIRMVERARQLTRADAVLALRRSAAPEAGALRDVDEE